QARTSVKRCLCQGPGLNMVRPQRVEKIEVYPAGPSCENVEIVVTLKNGGGQKCLNPDSSFAQNYIKRAIEKSLNSLNSVLNPLLFTLLTYDCSPMHPGCHIVKFADDTAVVGCITNSDESGYRQEVEHLEGWCRKNNLYINVKKTKEMIVNFRRGRHAHLPLHVRGSAVEVVSNYRYLGVHLSNNLTWSNNTFSLVRKAHQRLYFLRRLRQAGLGSSVLTSFYRCVVESVLCSSINVWHGGCSAADRKALQRVVKAAQRSVGVSLPTTTDIYTSRCRKRATCIMKDPTHPAHSLFVPLPSGRRLRSIKCKTNRLRNSFIPEAERLLNTTYVTLKNGGGQKCLNPDSSFAQNYIKRAIEKR
ncbi:hypothetical protein NFI96_013072, partial [Prochilodus magdalenae]